MAVLALLVLLGVTVVFAVLVGAVVVGIVGVAKKATWGLPLLVGGLVALVLVLVVAFVLVATAWFLQPRRAQRSGGAAVETVVPRRSARLAGCQALEALDMSRTYADVMNCKTS